MKLLTIDFEFTHATEPFQKLVCCATGEVGENDSHIIKTWWLADGSGTSFLKDYLLSHRTTHILVAYSVVAEARSLLALGLDPLSFKWFDPFIAFKMGHNKAKHHEGRKYGLTGCCQEFRVPYRFLQDEKDTMVELILSKGFYTDAEKESILDYCKSDIEPLPELTKKLVGFLAHTFKQPQNKMVTAIMNHSEYSAGSAIVENNGIHVDLVAIDNLVANHSKAIDFFVRRCSYPFWVQDEKGKWVFKVDIFDGLISKLGISSWPRTNGGKHFSSDSYYLKKNKIYSPHLSSLCETKKYLSCMSRFNPDKIVLMEQIGSDNRLRSFLGNFGSQTGRNQPQTKFFIFGFSSVFRTLMRPLPGFVVTEIDWSQQEVAIAGALSKDQKLITAYKSGDPYLAFAKMCGGLPVEATKESHPMVRQAFKSTVLGVQFGMGIRALRAKLTLDSGHEFSALEAEGFLSYHKRTFRRYWEWVKEIDRLCYKEIPLFTKDGWGLITDSSKEGIRSRRNFLVQGTGATLLRVAIVRALRVGLKVVASHHDSIYIEHPEGDIESPNKLDEIMHQTCIDVIGMDIGTDVVSHTSDKPWIAPKAVKIYPEFAKFIEGRI